MKNNSIILSKNNFILVILLFMTFYLLIDSKIVITTIIDMMNLFTFNVLPALFPFFILSDLLINYNFIYYLNKLLNKPFRFLLRINGTSSFVILMSMITGFPSGAKYTKQLLDEGYLDIDTANFLISFSHFSNPLFIFGTVFLFINNIKLTTIIFISHVLSNFIIAIICRPSRISTMDIPLKKKHSNSFVHALSKSIYSSSKVLLLIIGDCIFISIITTLILRNTELTPILDVIFQGLFDLTKGISSASLLKESLFLQCLFIVSFLSFGGFGVHLQVASIIGNSKIKYRNFLLGRICSVGISILLFIILFSCFT